MIESYLVKSYQLAHLGRGKTPVQRYITKHLLDSHVCRFPMTYQIAPARLVIVLGEGGGDDVLEAAWVECEHLGFDFLCGGGGAVSEKVYCPARDVPLPAPCSTLSCVPDPHGRTPHRAVSQRGVDGCMHGVGLLERRAWRCCCWLTRRGSLERASGFGRRRKSGCMK